MVKLYLHHVLMPPEALANAGQLVGVKLNCGFLVKTDVLARGHLSFAFTLFFDENVLSQAVMWNATNFILVWLW